MRAKHRLFKDRLIQHIGELSKTAVNKPEMIEAISTMSDADNCISDILYYLDKVIARGKTVADVNKVLMAENDRLVKQLRKYESNV